jgi:predicted MFS family arabinose efflux permease
MSSAPSQPSGHPFGDDQPPLEIPFNRYTPMGRELDYIRETMGIGQIAGGLLSLRWRPRRPMLVIAAGMSLTALPVVFLALEAPVWTLYLSLAAVGVEWGLYDPFWLTCMQKEVAPDMISRVSAYDYLGVLAFYPAGLALAGPLADALGRSMVLWFSAGVAILVSVFQLAWRDVRAPHDMGAAGAPAAPANPPH